MQNRKGSIINELKEENRKDSKNGYTNLLLDRLLINRGKKLADDGKLPTTIEYYNSGNVEMDEQQVIHSFVDMIVNNIYAFKICFDIWIRELYQKEKLKILNSNIKAKHVP